VWKWKPDVELQYGGRLGEFSGICHPRATYHIAGCCHLVNSLSRFQSHIAGCKNSIRHIENRFPPYFIYFFFVFNAVEALTSGGFRIVSDTLNCLAVCLSPNCKNAFFSKTKQFRAMVSIHEL